jgi:hypothetical protein
MRKLRAALTTLVVAAGVVLAAAGPARADFITTIISRWNYKCLDAEANSNFNGAKVQLWDCNGGTQQDWKLVPLGHSFYQIVNVKFNRCLDAQTQSITHDGTVVQLYDCLGTDNQKWFENNLNEGMIFENYGAYEARNDWASIALDANRNNPDNGTNIQLWHFLNYSNQYWIFGVL